MAGIPAREARMVVTDAHHLTGTGCPQEETGDAGAADNKRGNDNHDCRITHPLQNRKHNRNSLDIYGNGPALRDGLSIPSEALHSEPGDVCVSTKNCNNNRLFTNQPEDTLQQFNRCRRAAGDMGVHRNDVGNRTE